MTIQRVSTHSIHQSTLGDVNRTQVRLANLQNQISSGKKTNNFQGLGSQVEHFVSLESKMAKSKTYVENNAVVLSRVNTTRVVMENIIELVDDMEDLLLLSRSSSNGDALQFKQQMGSMRDRLGEMLNTSFEGRYLFGGSNTSAPPIKNGINTTVAGLPDRAYYNGSSEDALARIDDNIEIAYGVRGDALGFQKVMAAIGLSLDADTRNAGDPQLGEAYSLMQDALQDIIKEQTKVNANIVAIESVTTRHQELSLYWRGVAESLINTDIVEASTELAIDQTILQASFQSFASLNRLRLVDFL